jgi:hypothetical protein
MLLYNRLSIFINLSNKEILVYIPVRTRHFYLHIFINTSRQELTPTQPPNPSGWDVENDYHRFVLRLKKSGYKILLSHLP